MKANELRMEIFLQQVIEMKSKTLERILKEMENDPWYVKLKRWWGVRLWVWTCRTRWIWDIEYERNIFRKKKNK